MSRALYLFDDASTRSWEPFALTRPVGELLFGALLLRERAERYWRTRCPGHISHESLAGFAEAGAPPVLDLNSVSTSDPRVFLNSRFVPEGTAPSLPSAPLTLRSVDGEVVGWVLPEDVPNPPPTLLATPGPLPASEEVEIRGRLLQAPWELMDRNPHQVEWDIPRFFPGYSPGEILGSHILGTGVLSLGDSVEVEPGTVFDLRNGPIRLGNGVKVRAQGRQEGPLYVGPDSVILGGAISSSSIGPVCKIRGEVEASVILGYTNKAHDGFLGHAYLGRWVNLGALTTNSDLKNNYGPVRVGSSRGPVDTGLLKVGCLLGDHVKTGIGTLLNTGTVVGAGTNLFGGQMPPTYVPPFSWGTGDHLSEFRLDKFLELAARAMGRRGIELDKGTEGLLRRAWEATRPLRHRKEAADG